MTLACVHKRKSETGNDDAAVNNKYTRGTGNRPTTNPTGVLILIQVFGSNLMRNTKVLIDIKTANLPTSNLNNIIN